MIAELHRFSDDEIILKMKYTDLMDLGGEVYYLMNLLTFGQRFEEKDECNFPKCKEILEVIKNGSSKE